MPTDLLYWNGTVDHSVRVNDAAQVHSAIASVVDDKLGVARGFSLSDPSAGDSPENLAIAVDSIGRALIHTDDALD